MKKGESWEARVVRLGTADYDYTEVISGLEEGEEVALLSAVALQVQRQQNNDRMKAMRLVKSSQQVLVHPNHRTKQEAGFPLFRYFISLTSSF